MLEWLCRALPFFDYDSSHIEELFGWLRSNFERRWRGPHVAHDVFEPNIDARGIPSLGLLLALTTPEEVYLAVRTWDSMFEHVEDLHLEHIERALLWCEHLWSRDELRPYTRATLHGPMTFQGCLLAHADELELDRQTGSCAEPALRRLRESFERWPDSLRELPPAWTPENWRDWPALVRVCSRLRLPSPLSLEQTQLLLTTRSLEHITHMEFAFGFESEQIAEFFFQRARFDQLVELNILGDDPLGDRTLRALARTTGFPRLRSLTMEYAGVSEFEQAASLSTSPVLRGLDHLGLVEHDTTRDLIVAIPEKLSSLRVQTDIPHHTLDHLTDNLTKLPTKTLDIAFGDVPVDLDLSDSRASYQTVTTLLGALTELESVVASCTNKETFDALFDHLTWDKIVRLDVFGVELGDDRFAELLEVLSPNLRWLDISANNLTQRSLEALARHHVAEQLVGLKMMHSELGGALRSLAGRTRLESLMFLNVRNSGLAHNDIRALCELDELSTLMHLDLSANNLRASDLECLPDAPWANTLTRLNLNDIMLGDDIIWTEALDSYQNLRYVELKDASIGRSNIQALCCAPWARELRWLNLSCNMTDAASLEALTRAELPAIVGVSLGASGIDDEGARALLSSSWYQRLEFMNLAGNRFSEGVKQELRAAFGPGSLRV